jgi:DNA modification methylase
MRALPSSSIPLTVTSPPYDRTFEYGGHLWDWEKFMLVAGGLWRVAMPGGIVCWVVRDQISDGDQSVSSFRQAIYFKSLGFRLHNTIIVSKQVIRGISRVRYGVAPEFVFILSKGRPRTINLIEDKPNKNGGRFMRFTTRNKDGTKVNTAKTLIRPFGVRGNIWRYTTGSRMTAEEDYAYDHPALMPERLARDLIVSWSRPGDVVLDPFGGAATTAKMALLNHRCYLSLEVHRPYHEIAEKRMRHAQETHRRRLDAEFQLSSMGVSSGGE